jgi:triphosphoribosyl-dephospho-CoA synthase
MNQLNFSELAVLSLLLEVSSTPKSGNVDRNHDCKDLKFQHFLVSSVSALNAFKAVENRRIGIGEGIYMAVKNSVEMCKRNVHFGSFLLLIPLVSGSSSQAMDVEEIAEMGTEAIKKCSVEDSIYVLKAYRISKARVADVEKYSLKSIEENDLRRMNLKLYDWMSMAKNNVIANELLNSYPASIRGCKQIEALLEKEYSLNDAIVYTYHFLLSEYTDPLIVAEFGKEVAEEIKNMAREAMRDDDMYAFKDLDSRLISLGVNPGSIADLTASSIYLLLATRQELVFGML